MRRVRWGATRQHVLGVEAVLAPGEVSRAGGKHVKVSSGYDLTQLIIGSEGTLALVTEATVRLYPRLPWQATVLAPFASLQQVTAAVPRIVASGLGPLILEYVDMLTMAAITASEDVDLGVPAAVREAALAYLVVMVVSRSEGRGGGVAGRSGQRRARQRDREEELLPRARGPGRRRPHAAGEAGLRSAGHPGPRCHRRLTGRTS